MLADAAARAQQIDLEAVFPSMGLRRAGWRAAGATLVLLLVGFFCAGPARRSLDAASLLLFPSRARLSVRPGDARVTAGSPLTIEARLLGSRAPVQAQLEIDEGAQPRTVDMVSTEGGAFRLALDGVGGPFRYRVIAGKIASPTYAITVARPPRVTRVDLDYTYPASLGLKPRSEQDSGDVYAPAGTEVRVRVHTDLPGATGRLKMSAGDPLTLTSDESGVMSATLRVAADATYRIALADRDGLSSEGDTDTHPSSTTPAGPRHQAGERPPSRGRRCLTPMTVMGGAFELVYAAAAVKQAVVLDIHVMPLRTARHTLFLDLDINPATSCPGRARGIGWARITCSDIFSTSSVRAGCPRPSQSMSGSATAALDELVSRQRRSWSPRGIRPAWEHANGACNSDIRSAAQPNRPGVAVHQPAPSASRR